jgi:hypothetical protein
VGANVRITHDHLVLVEGKDEVNFFLEVARRRGLPEVQYMNYEGKSNLSAFLHTVPKLPDFQRVRGLAVTRDADNSHGGALNSIITALYPSGHPTLDGQSISASSVG